MAEIISKKSATKEPGRRPPAALDKADTGVIKYLDVRFFHGYP